jgi:hypothetical protein
LIKASCIGNHYFIHYTLAESTWDEEGNSSRGGASSTSEPFSSSRAFAHPHRTDDSVNREAGLVCRHETAYYTILCGYFPLYITGPTDAELGSPQEDGDPILC